jgi:hypothetical protein
VFAESDVMKARKLPYWIGLFCVAVLVLMPDITVNAQTEPGGKGSDGQIPNEVGGQGTDTQTSEEQQASEDPQPPEEKQTSEKQEPSNEVGQGTDTQTSAVEQTSEYFDPKGVSTEEKEEKMREALWTEEKEEKAREALQRRREAEQSLLDVGCQLVSSKPVKTGPIDWDLNVYDCPVDFSIDGLMREAEQSLIESDCQNVKTTTSPTDGAVWNIYNCPPGSKFHYYWPPEGSGSVTPGAWMCLVSPDPAYVPYWMVNTGEASRLSQILEVDADVMSGQCVPPASPQGGIRKRLTKDGQSPRPINVEKIAEPASYDSEGESDQQQAQSDQQANGDYVAQVDEEAQGEEARGEEAQGEENKASNQSQENDNSKKCYGCSAIP